MQITANYIRLNYITVIRLVCRMKVAEILDYGKVRYTQLSIERLASWKIVTILVVQDDGSSYSIELVQVVTNAAILGASGALGGVCPGDAACQC